MNYLETSSPRPSPPQGCGGEGEEARGARVACAPRRAGDCPPYLCRAAWKLTACHEKHSSIHPAVVVCAFDTGALAGPGPLLLLSNHVSWLDWLFLGCCLDESWRFVVSIEAANVSFVHRFIMLNRLTFPVDTDSPYAVKRMAEHLQAGGKLAISRRPSLPHRRPDETV